MADFSVVSNSPQMQAVVQSNALERAFHDNLFPNMLFRLDVEPEEWDAHTGDNRTFSAPGPIKPNQKPLQPGQDPVPQSYDFEQWVATMNEYANTIDTFMPNSYAAIANMFLRDAQQLGLNAAQSMNRAVRDRLYNGALSGNTVATAVAAPSVTIHVERLNGFTTARRPDLPTGSPVQFAAVSNNNPLPIIAGAALDQVANVIGFTPDTVGDTVGPGTVTLDVAITVNDRDPFLAVDRTFEIIQGGGNRTDDIGNTDLLTLSSIQAAVARLRNMSVPVHADGRYHTHLDPQAEQEVFQDTALQNLLKSLPEYYMSMDFALGVLYGSIFFRNQECPQAFPASVLGSDNDATHLYSPDDPFGAPTFNDGATTGQPLHFTLTTGGGWMKEYYADTGQLITDAGMNGKAGKWQITNNGIIVMADRIKMILRAPLDRLQQKVAQSWLFMGDWPIRTDVLTGDKARYKRGVVVISA